MQCLAKCPRIIEIGREGAIGRCLNKQWAATKAHLHINRRGTKQQWCSFACSIIIATDSVCCLMSNAPATGDILWPKSAINIPSRWKTTNDLLRIITQLELYPAVNIIHQSSLVILNEQVWAESINRQHEWWMLLLMSVNWVPQMILWLLTIEDCFTMAF